MTSLLKSFDLADLRDLLGMQISAEQTAVVTAPLAAGVVVAGAGSGKTATMVARVVWLVARGLVEPDGVLGLTFTTKAADELAGRVRTALRALRAAGRLPDAQADLEPVVSTYHAYAGRLVRDHALRLGREPGARLITPATSWQLAARAVATYDGPLDAKDMAESTAVQNVLALAGDLAEHLVAPQAVTDLGDRLRALADAAPSPPAAARDALLCQAVREQLLPVVARYTALKRERELLDFGDVVALAAQLARDCPEVRALERAAHRVVLLDEYQDTGAAQEVLLAELFGDGHAVTAVGDPCQSIYGWRGASAGTLRRFPARYGAAAAAGRQLSTTYRSGGRVLQLANLVAAELRTEGVPVRELGPAPGREHDGLVRCALLSDIGAEAAWVAAQVRDAVLALPADERGRHWSRAAVLCRKRALLPVLREAFEALEVPVEVVGLGGLLTVPEVADLVATLRVLDDPTADADLLRLLTGPRWRLGPRDLAALGRQARSLVRRAGGRDPADAVEAVVLGVEDADGGSLVDALDELPEHGLSDEGRRRLVTLRDELRALRRRADQPLPELVADVERTLGLDVEVVARVGAPGPAEARADLDAFADAAAAFAGDVAQDGSGEAVLAAFLAYLTAAADEENGLDTGGTLTPDGRLYRLDLEPREEWFEIKIERSGNYALFTEHRPEEFGAELRGPDGPFVPVLQHEYKPNHEHDQSVTSVGLREETPLERMRFQYWLQNLLNTRGQDIFRFKGVLNVQGMDGRVVAQGVHMISSLALDRPWEDDEPRISEMVFIGRNLDAEELRSGLSGCRIRTKVVQH